MAQVEQVELVELVELMDMTWTDRNELGIINRIDWRMDITKESIHSGYGLSE